jgi:hypothetical protein
MKKYAKYGLLMGVLLVANYESNDFPDMSEMVQKFKDDKEDPTMNKRSFITDTTAKAYEKRMMDLFEDMYNLGYI